MTAKLFLSVITILGVSHAQNPLAGLPSSPGSHVAQIQAMGDNTWLNLGSPAADPAWGKARGRSWGGYMAYAPELEGAFIAGQGVHGYISPDGRYDDLFFYDVNANRWICAFPGVKTTTFVADINAGNLKMRDDGQLVDAAGRPVLLSYAGHSYKTHIYAADLHRWVSVTYRTGISGDQYSNNMQWFTDGKALLEAQMAGRTDSVLGTPYFYNTATGWFERHHFNVMGVWGTGAVVYYLSSKQKLWVFDGNHVPPTTTLGDFATCRWTDAGASGSGPRGIDFGGCYDSRRDRIYLGAGSYGDPGDSDNVYSYDVASNAWTPHTTGQTFTNSNNGIVLYDPVSDRVLAVDRSYNTNTSTVIVTVRVLNPETWTWEETLRAPAGVEIYSYMWHGFYSPEHNAHFFYLAGDSDDRGVMWAYRYKRAVSAVRRVPAQSATEFSASPNPFRSSVTLDLGQVKAINGLDIFDTRGRNVVSVRGPVKTQFVWDAKGLPSGIYTVRIKTPDGFFARKILRQK